MAQRLVAGIDSSTRSCKVMVRDPETGSLVRSGVARHTCGSEADPEIWWRAFQEAVGLAGGLDDVAAVAVAGQQHGMVALDARGTVVRKALLWNDTRSAQDASDLARELGDGDLDQGRTAWAHAVGSVPVASLTVTKLRWLARHEPENAARTVAVALPHDWLSWRITGGPLQGLFTDRSEASGTGYFSGVDNRYDRDLLELAFGPAGRDLVLPTVLEPRQAAGTATGLGRELLVGPGAGDNAAAALGLDVQPGELIISIGGSGDVSVVSDTPTFDDSGMVTGFADATGRFLPLVCTLNASRTLNTMADALGVDLAGLGALAMSAPPGAEGLVLVPYLEGQRSPNRPLATGALHGIRTTNLIPSNLARAAVEGMLCELADGMDALRALGVPIERVSMIGGAARSEAVRRIAPSILGLPVTVPERGEYIADGAARQAAWVLSGEARPPAWTPRLSSQYDAAPCPFVRERYLAVRDLTVERPVLGMT